MVEPLVRKDPETVKKDDAVVAVRDPEAGLRPPPVVPLGEALREFDDVVERAMGRERVGGDDREYLLRYFRALRERAGGRRSGRGGRCAGGERSGLRTWGGGQPVTAEADLFAPEDLRRLERLRVPRRRTVRGEGRGEWRSLHWGTSGLFADHRPYAPGDDPRYVDWNVLGRLGELVVKRFEAEESLDLLLCVDRSLSMSGRKARKARRLAGALGYLALFHHDRVRLAWLPARGGPPLARFRGRARVRSFLAEVSAAPEEGTTDHVRDLVRLVATLRAKGRAVLVSDFFDPAGAIRGLSLLKAHGQEVGAIHVVDPEDAEIPPTPRWWPWTGRPARACSWTPHRSWRTGCGGPGRTAPRRWSTGASPGRSATSGWTPRRASGTC